MKRYQQLAEQIGRQIRAGVMLPGERVPSVRMTRRAHKVSPATALQAYRLLESQGLIRAKPRSGYYVSANWAGLPAEPLATPPPRKLTAVKVSDLVFEILASVRDPKILSLGSPFMNPGFFPLAKLARFIGAGARRTRPAELVDSLPPGISELRRMLARRYLDCGCVLRPDQIVVTNGALEALTLSLKVLARPGDIVAIEAPAFYAQLQALQSFGMRAVQIATEPREGMDLSALSAAIGRQTIKACWLMTNFQNPMGCLMPEEKKKDLVKLLGRHGIPLIEDDVYEELYFGLEKPRPAKAFDGAGLVLHCSSFSKTVGPGYRVGWAAAGRFTRQLEREKWMTTITTNIPGQAGMAEYLKHGGYDHDLRRLRSLLALQRDQMLSSIAEHFPAGTRATRPEGGYFTWVELPQAVNALKLHRMALDHGISIAPGPIFSVQRGFENFVRLNYGQPWSPRLAHAMKALGAMARSLV